MVIALGEIVRKRLSRQSINTGVLRFAVFSEVNKSPEKLSDNWFIFLSIVFCTRKFAFL